MCGIIGAIGICDCAKHILNGLKQLQNRGYDSAGVCSLDNNGFKIKKFASDSEPALGKLEKEFDIFNNQNLLMGHTRWATHGAKTDINSHPHPDQDGLFVVVHNGIIENFDEIKSKLIKKGYRFNTQTDTEVIPNLLNYYYHKYTDLSISSIISIVSGKLEGTFALLIFNRKIPDRMYCIRKGSPLVVSFSDQLALVSSEISGFNNEMNSYFILDNHDICEIGIRDEKLFYKTNKSYIDSPINKKNFESSPHPYNYWMEKEILEQDVTINQSINFGARIVDDCVKLRGPEDNSNLLEDIKHIVLLGCGTSYNACMLAKYNFRELCSFDSISVIDGADFTHADIPNGKTLAILVSQSGETKDLHRCIDIANENDVVTCGVINVVDSLIAREVDFGVYLNAGREVAVASTKVFLNEVVVLTLIAMWFSQTKNINTHKRLSFLKEMHKLVPQIKQILSDLHRLDDWLDLFKDKNSCFVLGKNKGYPIAAEGALKIKEVSYMHAESYPASSLKHGPFGLLEPGFPVIFVNPKSGDTEKIKNAYQEVLSREAVTMVITDDPNWESPLAFHVPYNHHFGDLLCTIPLQYLAFKLSLARNINPDFPRNLAKVVTVE